MAPPLKVPSAATNVQGKRSRPEPNGGASSGGRSLRPIEISRKVWLVVSASEWAASASIAAEPLIAPAAIFAIAIVAFEASAIDAVRRLSALRPGRRLRLLAWTAGRGRGAAVSAAPGMFDLYPPDGRAEPGW